MLSRTLITSIISLSLFSILSLHNVPTAQACSIDGSSGFAPENDVKIPVNYVFATAASMDEKTFNDIIDRVENVYAPIVSQHQARLSVERNWDDPTANAYAKREGAQEDEWIVAMFGGLARHPDMTNDGFMLVMCHEVGHHLGGAPIYVERIPGQTEWASNEGQADYFGALKCMKKVLERDNNEAIMRNVSVPSTYTNRCTKSYSSNADRALCKRIAMAGDSLGKTLASLARERNPTVKVPKPSTPDKSKVTETYDPHPAAQCRLDTYFSAAACTANPYVDVSQTDPTVGTCSQEKGATVGFRPRCWYAPGNSLRTRPQGLAANSMNRQPLNNSKVY